LVFSCWVTREGSPNFQQPRLREPQRSQTVRDICLFKATTAPP
jgi:hypothetical protein